MRLLCLILLNVSTLAFPLGPLKTINDNPVKTTRRYVLSKESKFQDTTTNPDELYSSNQSACSRRTWMANTRNQLLGLLTVAGGSSRSAMALDDDNNDDEDLDALYENPAIPKAPEERSGLVVLRVAEVAQFQEKILRAVAAGELEGVKVSPMQFVFGTQILLRNSNLDGNMKLMIGQEIERKYRDKAIKNCVNALNTLQYISSYAASIQRDFKTEEMIELADMYRDVRINLNQLYEYLPQKEKDKYYGYFVAVTEYEKKIAQGTYNPDIDGKLKFDY